MSGASAKTPMMRMRTMTHALCVVAIALRSHKTMTMTMETRVAFVVARCILDVEHAAAIARRSCAQDALQIGMFAQIVSDIVSIL